MDILETLPAIYKETLLDYGDTSIINSTSNQQYSPFGGSRTEQNHNTYPYKAKHFAANSAPVRSKNEAIIYNMLLSYDIPFYYEKPIKLKDSAGMRVEVSPDFTILTHDGKIIIHEHFGMLHEQDYRMNFADKIWLYLQNGFVLWRNLFITTNGENDSIDTASIDYMIKNFILPKVKM